MLFDNVLLQLRSYLVICKQVICEQTQVITRRICCTGCNLLPKQNFGTVYITFEKPDIVILSHVKSSLNTDSSVCRRANRGIATLKVDVPPALSGRRGKKIRPAISRAKQKLQALQ